MTTTTTRRAVLAGAAALPALAMPAMAGQRSDRELVALDRELDTAHARMTEAHKISREVSDRYHAVKPPKPAEPQPPAEYNKLLRTMTVGELGRLPADHPLNVWDRETEEQRLAINSQWLDKCKQLQCECGVDVAEENASNLSGEVWEIGQRIFATRAHTFDGMKIKLRTVGRLAIRELPAGEDADNLADVLASLEKDINGLTGGDMI